MAGAGHRVLRSNRLSAGGLAKRKALSVERSQLFEWLVRAGFVARAVSYALIGALALALALGAGTDGTAANQQGALALIVQAPLSGAFAKTQKGDRMSFEQRVAFLVIGRIGLTARACVFALVGYFLLRAAIDYSPRSAVGIDGALARLHHQPLGPVLLGLTAA